MATLTYWVATRTDDSDKYSIIAKTKKECQRQLSEAYGEFDPIEKRSIYYKDAFDLFDQATSEAGGRTWTGLKD
jgi:hypothetical protein